MDRDALKLRTGLVIQHMSNTRRVVQSFFFQAEDGIRDLYVTGVQTCALPIWSIGLPLPGVEVRLVDEGGEDALAGDSGEVWVRGPNVFPGYWHDQEATAAVLTPEGWLRTGDVAVTDDDGYLYLVDRAKDLIIVSGFNVFPAEVEDVLVEHPGIAQAEIGRASCRERVEIWG